MRKFRVKLCMLITVMALAMVGAGISAFAGVAYVANADQNGWDKTVYSEEASSTAEYFRMDGALSTFRNLKKGQVVTFNTVVKFDAPFQLSFKTEDKKANFRFGLATDRAKSVAADYLMDGHVTYNSVFAKAGKNQDSAKPYGVNNEGVVLATIYPSIYGTRAGGVNRSYTAAPWEDFNSTGSYKVIPWDADIPNKPNFGQSNEAYLSVVMDSDMEELSVGFSYGAVIGKLTDFNPPSGNPTGTDNETIPKFVLNIEKNVSIMYLVQGGPWLAYGNVKVKQFNNLTKPYFSICGDILDVNPDGTADYVFTSKHHDFGAGVASVMKEADYKITYKDGDTAVKYQYRLSNEKASAPSVKLPGKKVTGWYTDVNCTAAYDFNSALTGDLTLYAKTSEVAAVTFNSENADGENVEIGKSNLAYDGRYEKPVVNPTLADFTFAGWYADEALSEKFDFDKIYTESQTVYAGFKKSATFRILGYDTADQKAVALIKRGDAVTAADAPEFKDVTGMSAFSNLEVKWYKDGALTQALIFPYTMDSGAETFYGAAADKSLDKDDVVIAPGLGGWDTNTGSDALTDEAGNKLVTKDYGSNGRLIDKGEGFTQFLMNYNGYIANATGFDVTKDVYFDYTIANQHEHSTGAWFLIAVYNNLTGAVTGLGPDAHKNQFGNLASFGHNTQDDSNKVETWGTRMSSVDGAFSFVGGKGIAKMSEKVSLVLKIGVNAEDSGLYQIKSDNTQVKVAGVSLTRSMFPTGKMYFTASSFLLSTLNIRIAQSYTVAADTAEHGTATIAQSSAVSGSKVYLTLAPEAGYAVGTEFILVNGKSGLAGKDDTGYYVTMPAENAAVKVSFAREVKFYDGTEYLGSAYAKNETEMKPFTAPDKLGFLFIGWYSDSALTAKYDFSSVSAPASVYAKYAEGLIVTFKAEGQTVKAVTVGKGEKVASIDAPEKFGYDFAGWCTDEALTTLYDFDGALQSELTLFAKYKLQVYTVTFSSEGKTYKTSSVERNSTAAKPEDPVREGYEFGGWFVDEECSEAYSFESKVLGSKTVYAKWTKTGGCSSCGKADSTAALGLVFVLAAAAVGKFGVR